MTAHSSPLPVRFPRVLDRMDYAHRVTRSEVVVDGKEVLKWYCSWATDGIKYEWIVQSAENQGVPDCLIEANISNLTNVRGRGWSWATLQPFVNQPLAELQTIPPDASLFETKEHDRAVIQLVNRFCRLRGTKIANATKLLYQKRPGLIPIIDEFARRAFDLPWTDGPLDDFSQTLRMAFWNLREFEQLNSRSLDELQAWNESAPDATAGLRFSRLRIIDILAWGAIKRDEVGS